MTGQAKRKADAVTRTVGRRTGAVKEGVLKEDRECWEEESKAEEISKTEDAESCGENTKGVTKYEEDNGTGASDM